MKAQPVTIYISLGSNIEPEKNIKTALKHLYTKLDNYQASGVYRSAAVGMVGADFYNAVVGGSTTDSVRAVKKWLHESELTHGRVRTENKFSDRTLDLDLLLYGNTVCQSADPAGIVLPHPEIKEHAYVLQPLADIAGTLVHPTLHCTISQILSSLQTQYPEKFEALLPVTL